MPRAVTRTTVYLDAEDYRRIKELARRRGRTPAALIREAVRAFASQSGSAPRPKSIASGRSRRGDVAKRAEELLEGFGRS